jgi:hypothetical protein
MKAEVSVSCEEKDAPNATFILDIESRSLTLRALDFNLGINFGKIVQEKIIVTVPNGMNLNKMIIEGTSGQKTCVTLKLKTFKLT